MSANNFEQELEQRLAQLQMKPSDGVWQKLEAGLQRKKRRRAFFLFFLAALLCTGGGYGIWMQSGHPANQLVNTSPENTMPGSNEPATGNKAVKGNDNETVNTITDKVEIKTIPADNNPAIPGLINNTVTTTTATNTQHHKAQTKYFKQPALKPVPVKEGALRNNKNNIPVPGNTGDLTDAENATRVVNNDLVAVRQYRLINAGEFADRKYTGLNDTDQVTTLLPDAAKFPQPVNTKEPIIQKVKQKYPFYWGVEVLAGVSGSVEKKEPFGKSAAQMDAINSPNPNPNPSYYNASSPLLNNTAIWESQNVHRASTSHSFGVVGYKQFTKRSAVSFGVSYQYLSTATKVGDSATTVNSNNTMRTYYSGGVMKNYINKFHFINIPVTHHLILNRNENMPFSWDLGMSVSQLLSTNALVMSSYLGGSLHEDKQAFTKTHFFIHTGLTIGLANNKNRLWQLGPVVSYGLNKIGQEKSDDKNFWQVGIKLRCLLR